MLYPIWTDLLDQSMYAPLKTTMMLGEAKLGYIYSVWNNYFNYPNNDYNDLLNPQTAIDMVAAKMKNNSNGSWSNFGFPSAGATNAGNGKFNFKFDFSGLNGGGGASGGGTATPGSSEANSLQSYINVLNTLKKNGALNEEQIKAYNEAMKKSTDAEKLAAIKEVFKTISQDNIKTAVLDDDEIKKALKEAGYFYGLEGSDIELDDATANMVNSLTTEDKTGDVFTTLASNCLTNKNIIEVLSYWNEAHKEDEDRCILRYVANHLTDTDYSNGMSNFVLALKNAAKEFSDSPAIKSKIKALDDAYDKNLKKALTEYTDATSPRSTNVKNKLKEAILKVVPAFEALYAQIRIQQAAKIDNLINEKYGKEINTTIPNLIEADTIQNAIKSDLENEGITGIPKADKIQKKSKYQKENKNYKTTDERIDTLINEGTISETEESQNGEYEDMTIFESAGNDENGNKQYFTVIDDKLVKFKGQVKGKKLMSSDGKTTLCQDITNPELLKAVHYAEVKRDSEILTVDKKAEKEEKEKAEQKEKTEKDIDKLVDAGILEEKNDGTYHSKKYNCDYKIDEETGLLYNTTKNRNANMTVMLNEAKKVESGKSSNSESKESESGKGKTYKDYQEGSDEYRTAFSLGRQLSIRVKDATDEDEGKEFNEKFQNVNKYNVKAVIEGFEDHHPDALLGGLFCIPRLWNERFCDQIMNENGDDMHFKRLETVVRMMGYVIEYGKDNPNKVNKEGLQALEEKYELLKKAVWDDGDTSKPANNDKNVNVPEGADSKTTTMLEALKTDSDTEDEYFEVIDDLIYNKVLSIKHHGPDGKTWEEEKAEKEENS